jgi:hypothetical protein
VKRRSYGLIGSLLALGAMTGMFLVQANVAHAAGEPVATLSAPTTIVEGTGGTTFLAAQIVLDVPAPTTLSVTFTTTDGSASSTGGEDFTAQSVTVTFLAGAIGPADINIPITTDGIDEPDETFSISLTPNSADVIVAGSPITTTIVDDDAPLVATLSAPTTVVEGTGGTNLLPAQITLSRPAPTTFSMTFTTTDGSASSIGGEDFAAQSITVTFLAGAVGPASLNIPITTDGVDEPDETFSMSLTTDEFGVTVAGSPVTTTIEDDDAPLVATLSAPTTVVEGTGGPNLIFPQVTLSRPAPTTFSMTFATTDGSASSIGGEDFAAQSITVTFLTGAVGPATFTLPITTDGVSESNETFSMSLTTDEVGVTVAGSPVTTTIIDDDDTVKPTVTIEQGSGQVDPTSSATVTFDVAFDEPVVGFDGSDVTLGGTAGATTATVTGGPQLYTVAVTGMTRSGTVVATIAAAVASDGHGNTNTASTSLDNAVAYVAPPVVLGATGAEGTDRTISVALLLLLCGLVVLAVRRLTRPHNLG